MAELSYPQTDSRQTERQRERQGTVVDYAEQEFARSKETLKQMAQVQALADAPGADKAEDTPAEGQGHRYPGVRQEHQK